jgi:glycosyltransferase involved in cell wall biosynthesis
MITREYLLDVTRLISLGWTQRRETGIDRVCIAYLNHFAEHSHAVVQYRGSFRILNSRQSDELFDLIRTRVEGFRKRFLAFAPSMLMRGLSQVNARGALYLNVSHTDFDLDSHIDWARSCKLRAVYLIHDLIPITHAEHCRPQAVLRHRGRVINALNTATGIIVNSRATRKDLEQFATEMAMPLPPVMAAPLAGAALSIAPTSRRPSAEPYFLCVGTIEPRKNHMLLLRIWLTLAQSGQRDLPRLVIIGQWGARSSAIRRFVEDHPALHPHVTILDHCSDTDLARWMVHAQALLIPTMAEGFGLPLVEALSMAIPVIASDLPCFRESGQGIPLLLKPNDQHIWEGAIRNFKPDGRERRRQKELMRTYRAPAWSEHFARVDQWLSGLTKGHTPRKLPLKEAALCS